MRSHDIAFIILSEDDFKSYMNLRHRDGQKSLFNYPSVAGLDTSFVVKEHALRHLKSLNQGSQMRVSGPQDRDLS